MRKKIDPHSFKLCERAAHKFERNDPLTEQEKLGIDEARRFLFKSIAEIAEKGLEAAPVILRVMNGVHSEVYESDSLMRDVAEKCVTLRRVSQRQRRSEPAKLANAALFCANMYYALRDE